MGVLHNPTPAEQLAEQLRHPDASTVWNRALEVFGEETKAKSWMTSGREVFGGRSPQELVNTGRASEQRHVLEVLLRIEYGVFS